MLIGILSPIFWDAFNGPEVPHVVPVADAAVETIYGKEVMIEVRYDWTEERIIEEINNVFPDAPIMVKVAKCEGVVDGKLDPKAYNPTNDSHDKGIFQISEKYHGTKIKELGLDMYDIKDNLAFARILYDNEGLTPWKWSKPCWKHAL